MDFEVEVCLQCWQAIYQSQEHGTLVEENGKGQLYSYHSVLKCVHKAQKKKEQSTEILAVMSPHSRTTQTALCLYPA